MTRSFWITIGCILLSTLGLALGLILAGSEFLAPVVAILGIFWIVSVQREWKRIASPALFIYVAATAYAAWQGSPPGLMLMTLIFALSAWDLESMRSRFRMVKADAVDNGIEQRHLIRLVTLDGIGILLGSMALVFRITLNFALELILGVVIAYGLSQLVLFLRRPTG